MAFVEWVRILLFQQHRLKLPRSWGWRRAVPIVAALLVLAVCGVAVRVLGWRLAVEQWTPEELLLGLGVWQIGGTTLRVGLRLRRERSAERDMSERLQRGEPVRVVAPVVRTLQAQPLALPESKRAKERRRRAEEQEALRAKWDAKRGGAS